MLLGRFGNRCGRPVGDKNYYMLTIKELKKVYNGKKVLITGHTGFKGSYACVLLKYLGAKVYGYSLKPEKNSLYEILSKESVEAKKNVGASFASPLVDDELFADIRNFDKLKSFIKKVKPDFVLHMAAQPLVLLGYEEPRYTYEVNVMGTVNLLEAVRASYASPINSVKANHASPLSILNVTTDKVYENNDLSNYAFKENDKLCGRDPYANSKSCSEIVTYAYNKSFFQDKNIFRISTARAGNVIGGGDFNKDRIIPDCYRAIKDNKDMIVRNPSSIRPYQYVLEPLLIYLNIMAYQLKDKKHEGNYNIGPDKKDCLTTKDLVEKFYKSYMKICPIDANIIFNKVNTQKSHEAKFLRLDNTLIKKTFNYKKIYSMDETMNHTAEIYNLILNKKRIIPHILSYLK